MGDIGPNIKELLLKCRLRPTQARLSILDVLIKATDPLTLEQIFRQLLDLPNPPNWSTLYRNVTMLHKAGLLEILLLDKHSPSYRLVNNSSHQHSVTCFLCKQSKDLGACVVSAIEARLRAEGYEDIRHTLEIQARCPTCNYASNLQK